ncbi:hypothetical protein ACHRV6_09395 [Flavobacterium sp. FlaQc-51]|uniref:hypothetical protein n=1 Tax=unclassified Flavobacterium TaxID=196869 RepID=UPI00103C1551|nr:hypothetical protein [Flavobacterium sp. Leaf82]
MIIFTGCNKNVECKEEGINEIYFKGFNILKIKKISFEDLKDSKNNLEYINPNFDSTDLGIKEFKTNQLTSRFMVNGFIVTINDTIKYKISNIKMEEVYIEKKTMWNAKLYGCSLKEYELNDSLIQTHSDIVIYK